MFLDADQLVQLTGRKRAKAQCAFLAREGYHFRVNARGEPVVLVAEVHKRFGVALPSAPVRSAKSIVDWDAMEARGMIRRRPRIDD